MRKIYFRDMMNDEHETIPLDKTVRTLRTRKQKEERMELLQEETPCADCIFKCFMESAFKQL